MPVDSSDIEKVFGHAVNCAEDSLDEAVHDTASEAASNANNGGLKAQIKYLLDHGWTVEELIKYCHEE